MSWLLQLTVFRFLSGLIATAGLASCAFSQENLTSQAFDKPYALVSSYSRSLFEQLFTSKIELDMPVKVWILDAWVVGQAHAQGTASIDFKKLQWGEPLPIQFDGEIVARVNVYRRPLVVATLSRIPFQAELRVGFDGDKLYIAQGTATAHCKSALKSIRTQRGRLGSRLITRLGWRTVPSRLAPYDAEASRLAEIQILKTMSAKLLPTPAQAHHDM